ncbi:hypothetical protein H6P81_005466 [Aristolochia fimbriata]|uniref:Receptor-like serine/threonine-protein kinase n=1 Tax=Aristolochia fimbriata TaxID=158543 RepID=A0AAV7EY32_ARIFI|nr:hypothetical protein H6P81_005466 [Aristolochia fimbriata]
MVCNLSLLFPAFLLFFSISANAQTHRNISLSSSISAGSRNASWVSPSGDFAVGFRPLDGNTSLFLLAVWFDKVPDKTVVWSANGADPLPSGSKLELTFSGGLLLSDDRGREVWKRDSVNGAADYAAILDTGNFVLVNSGPEYAWESFAEPTDTLLPAQMFSRGSELYSRRAATNFSRGRFKLRLRTDGMLVLIPLSYQDQTYEAIWDSDTLNTGRQLILPNSGYFYLLLADGSRLNFSTTTSLGDVYQRATLGFDGVFRQLVHPKSPTNNGGLLGSWTSVLSFPRNICRSIAISIGSGVCGFNSYCRSDANGNPSCLCPPGYSYLDPSDSLSGCKQNFVSQSCVSQGSNVIAVSGFEMVEVPSVNWPLGDYERYASVDEEFCRAACLQDCRCAVAVFDANGCWKKRLPLSNGRLEAGSGGKGFVKVGKTNSTTPTANDSGKGGKSGKTEKGSSRSRETVEITSWLLLGCSGALFLLSATLLCVFFLIRGRPEQSFPKSDGSGANLMSFTYRELEEMTSGFGEVLGVGASGTVYKGIMSTTSITSTKLVAVKKLDKLPNQNDQEFKNELTAIAKVHHKNLVPLLGFCDEGPNRLLVYEFMSNGSLADLLFSDLKPCWNQRVHIAFGIARGLLYLHEECQKHIIHCDIKPQNVLLDDTFVPRISDFGMAKLLNPNQTRTTTNIRGTRGYVAPEWFKSMPVTPKVDVYSFGVLLLEIICCRRSIEPEVDGGEPGILTFWAFDCYREGTLGALVEDDREALQDGERLERLLMVGIWCIQEEPSLRPTMWKVIQMLEGVVQVPRPPDPSSMSSLA